MESVTGQTHAMTWMARPFRMEAAATATSAAGAINNPASAVTPRKNRGARLSCAIWPARNTSHSRTSTDTAKNAYGRISRRLTPGSVARPRTRDHSRSSTPPLFAAHLARSEAAREHVEGFLRVVRGEREDVEQEQVTRRKRVCRHVTVVQQQHHADRIAGKLPHHRRPDHRQPRRARAGNQESADQCRVAQLGRQSANEIGAEVAERRRHVERALQGDERPRPMAATAREDIRTLHRTQGSAKQVRWSRLAARRGGSLVCGMSRERLMTLPNVVSMSRLVLAAAFIALRAPSSRLVLLLVASVTDVLDGWLARRQHAVTRYGAL